MAANNCFLLLRHHLGQTKQILVGHHQKMVELDIE